MGVHENVLHDEEIEVPQPCFDFRRVRIGLHGVLAHDVGRPDAPVAHPVHDFGELLALLVGERAPEPGETLVPQLGIRLDVAGQGFGERAHIAGALHVVLPAQGDEPGEGRPIMPQSMTRFASAPQVRVPVTCWVTPMQ